MLFKAEGYKCIEALSCRYHLKAVVCVKEKQNLAQSLINTDNIELYEADDPEMRKLSSFSTPSGIIGIFELKSVEMSESELAQRYKEHAVVILDDIQDPGNLGTIIRTCDWFGINTNIASKNTADAYNPKVVQSTMGSLARVDIIYADLNKLLEENGQCNVYGTFMNGESIYETTICRNAWIVMGNEGNGIGKDISKYINYRLTIPPYNKENHPESLNVGIATAIILSSFRYML